MNLQESRDRIEYRRALEKFYGNQLTSADTQSIIKEWDEDDHPRDENGRFTSGGSSNKKTKYSPSPQRQKKGVQVSHKKYAQLTGIMNTQYPNLKPEDGERTIYDAKNSYKITADGYGGMIIHSRMKLN